VRCVTSSEDPLAFAVAPERLRAAMESLVRLAASHRAHQRQAAAAKVRLSRQGFLLLRNIAEAGRITPTELARRTGIDPAVITRQTRQLAAEGLIIRRRDETDGRSSTLAPTGSGTRALRRMKRVLDRHMEIALESWTHEDVELLANLMRRLVHDLRAMPYPELPPC
jgi:DNA-binding MarR family transcriptional regulator